MWFVRAARRKEVRKKRIADGVIGRRMVLSEACLFPQLLEVPGDGSTEGETEMEKEDTDDEVRANQCNRTGFDV